MELQQFLDCVEQGQIPPEAPDGLSLHGEWINKSFEDTMAAYKAHDFCIARGMWAIVDRQWTRKLADWIGDRNTLEIMAGRGWLAKALSEHGVPIIATDNYAWGKRHDKGKNMHPVIRMRADTAIRRYPDAQVLIVSWPPYGETDIVDAAREWGGDRPIVYIGEEEGGCNAPDEFFTHFALLEDQPSIPLMSWDGIHDIAQIGYWRP